MQEEDRHLGVYIHHKMPYQYILDAQGEPLEWCHFCNRQMQASNATGEILSWREVLLHKTGLDQVQKQAGDATIHCNI